MTKLELYNELAQCIDKDIQVKYNEDFNETGNFIIFEDNLIVISYRHNDIINFLTQITLLDLGFKWYNYCTYDTFCFLHEIGHYVNGVVSDDYEFLTECLYHSTLPPIKIVELYIKLDDEYYAWLWAYEFVKKNKKYIRRMEREML